MADSVATAQSQRPNGAITGSLLSGAECEPKPDGVENFRRKGRFSVTHRKVIGVSDVRDSLDHCLWTVVFEISCLGIHVVTSNEGVRLDRRELSVDFVTIRAPIDAPSRVGM